MNPDADTGTMLDMYKTAVEMADRVSARRGTANTFFVTLNAALAAVVGIVTAARKPPPLTGTSPPSTGSVWSSRPCPAWCWLLCGGRCCATTGG